MSDRLKPIGPKRRYRYSVDLLDAFAEGRERLRIAQHDHRAATSTTTSGSDE